MADLVARPRPSPAGLSSRFPCHFQTVAAKPVHRQSLGKSTWWCPARPLGRQLSLLAPCKQPDLVTRASYSRPYRDSSLHAVSWPKCPRGNCSYYLGGTPSLSLGENIFPFESQHTQAGAARAARTGRRPRWVTGSDGTWGTPASTARCLPLGNLAPQTSHWPQVHVASWGTAPRPR